MQEAPDSQLNNSIIAKTENLACLMPTMASGKLPMAPVGYMPGYSFNLRGLMTAGCEAGDGHIQSRDRMANLDVWESIRNRDTGVGFMCTECSKITLAMLLARPRMFEDFARCFRLKTPYKKSTLQSVLISSYSTHARHACLCLGHFVAIAGRFSLCQKCIAVVLEGADVQKCPGRG